MVTYHVEVVDRFEQSRPAREYVYSPVPEDCELRETRVYEISGPDDVDRLGEFVENVLVDDVSQTWKLEETAGQVALDEYDTFIDVSLKSDVLDLEEQYLLEYCEEDITSGAFELDDLRIVTRYYLSSGGAGADVVDTVVRDLVNPVIHEWSVQSRGNGR